MSKAWTCSKIKLLCVSWCIMAAVIILQNIDRGPLYFSNILELNKHQSCITFWELLANTLLYSCFMFTLNSMNLVFLKCLPNWMICDVYGCTFNRKTGIIQDESYIITSSVHTNESPIALGFSAIPQVKCWEDFRSGSRSVASKPDINVATF